MSDSQLTKVCPQCKGEFASTLTTCPQDGAALAEKQSDPLIGTLFADKYEIESVLGMGGMSIVYKARHKYMGRTVAVKLLLRRDFDDPTAFKRFEQESKACSKLDHQNIVRVYDFGLTSNQQPYFVMDCLVGDSLQDVIFREGRLEIHRAVEIFRQICEGLQHAHKKEIVHRDLKPSNIVLIKEEDGSESVKIVDFGLAKMHGQEGATQQRLTQTGEVFGSPLYMSPEQCQGQPLDGRSDIYSMGCLMYEALAGVPPFDATSFFDIALLHVTQKAPAFSVKVPDAGIPAELEAVVLTCLAKKQEDRFESADQLRQRLLDAALVGGVPGYKPGAVPVPEGGRISGVRQTWQSMKAVLDSQGFKLEKKVSPWRVIMGSAFWGVIAISLAIGFLWPGPEGDQGTPFAKMYWQTQIAIAQQQMERGDFSEAEKTLTNARSLAQKFGDNQTRLKTTLEQQADLYHKWSKFPEEEKTNKELADMLTNQVLAEAEKVKAHYRELSAEVSSEAQKTTNQQDAAANANRVMLSSKRLSSRGLHLQNQAVLEQAIAAYTRLQMTQSDQMADFQTALSDCMSAQRQFVKVLPPLQEALKICKNATTDGTERSWKRYIKAELKLGDCNMDQSHLNCAKEQLFDALDLTEKRFPKDSDLMYRCLNSCAELERQMDNEESYLKLSRRLKQYKLAPDAPVE